jgi:hypothetical protein
MWPSGVSAHGQDGCCSYVVENKFWVILAFMFELPQGQIDSCFDFPVFILLEPLLEASQA